MNKNDLLNRLVDNALDFLSHSIDEFEQFPKYSVIHFYTAVELFMKARLMSEHWSLVVSKRQQPEWDALVAGDFQSVTLDEAANRLDKVVRSGLSHQEFQGFREVGRHRNKMVHFFHGADSVGNDALHGTIARQQLNAWYLLHQLLLGQWQDVFGAWSKQISEIDVRLRTHRAFLQVVFEHLKPKMKQLEETGTTFRKCPSCEFMSQQHEAVTGEFYESICLVCGLSEKRLTIQCPDCGKPVDFVNEGFAKCPSCGRHVEPEDVVDALIDDEAAHRAKMGGDDSRDLGNCSDCDGYHTVVRVADGNYVCASCFGVFESLRWCGWCNEPNTGDMEDSCILGCSHCEGRAACDSDDD